MTREEMRMKRELQKAIEKDYLRPISKSHGYKMIGGIPYIVHNDWLYTILVSNSHNSIRIVIEVKPVITGKYRKDARGGRGNRRISRRDEA